MAATDVAPVRGLVGDTAAARRARLGELAFQSVMLFALLLALVILLVLISDIVVSAFPVFAERGTGFVTDTLSSRPNRAGVWQGIVGSVQLVVITVILAFPIGIATAVYLEEYAPPTRLTRFIDVNIRNLAGVPSIVYGLLGLAVFVGTLGPPVLIEPVLIVQVVRVKVGVVAALLIAPALQGARQGIIINIGLTFFWATALVTLYTGYDYFRAGLRHVIDNGGGRRRR